MKTRTEHDLLGNKEVPMDAYYGVQTLRAIENFGGISGFQIGMYPNYVKALAMVKWAAANYPVQINPPKLQSNSRKNNIPRQNLLRISPFTTHTSFPTHYFPPFHSPQPNTSPFFHQAIQVLSVCFQCVLSHGGRTSFDGASMEPRPQATLTRPAIVPPLRRMTENPLKTH